MIAPEKCQFYAAECLGLAAGSAFSVQRAAALSAMAQSCTNLDQQRTW
jgi:hypothetical protein